MLGAAGVFPHTKLFDQMLDPTVLLPKSPPIVRWDGL
jgi:hypothetical protein